MLFAEARGGAEDTLEKKQLMGVLRQALTKLPEREALVLQPYYVEEMNVYEVAAVLGVTTGRVSQIKKSAIEKLRDSIQGRLD